MFVMGRYFEFELRGLPFFEVIAWNIALLRSELQKLLSSGHVHTQSTITHPRRTG